MNYIALSIGLLVIAGFLFWQWRKSKKNAAPKENKTLAIQQPVPAVTVTKVNELECPVCKKKLQTKFGYNGHMKSHTAEEIAKAAMAKTTPDVPKPEMPKVTAVTGKYPALVITTEGFKFRKIPEKIGNIYYLEPSLPKSGANYLVKETPPNMFQAYDPREEPILSEETPQKAYRAVMWDVVRRVYQYRYGIWERVNSVLIGIICCGAFIVALVAIDKMGK